MTSRPGRASAHSLLRANSTTGPLRFSARQRLRVLHVGGGEHLRLRTGGDLVLQQTRCAELRLHLAEACGFESVCHLGQRGTQAAGRVEQDRFLCHRRRHHDQENRKR